MRLNGKVALITGGTGGIGSATAISLACRGADIAVTGLSGNAASAASVEQQILSLRRRCLVMSCDLAEPKEAANCIHATVEALGGLDVLVHCAGGPAPGSLRDVEPETWYAAFDIHVHAVFHLCRAAVPEMRRRGEGAIVLVSSAAGLRGCSGAIAYGAAKGALPQLARSLARELAEDNIRVNCVSPGVIRTRFQSSLTTEQVRNNIENRIPLHREGSPDEVAELITLLVTNGFITGENVSIDGGMTMRIV